MKTFKCCLSLGVCIMAAVTLLALAPINAEANVVATGSWEIHQNEFANATDLHFTIYQKESSVHIEGYQITVTLLEPCPGGVPFASDSFYVHDDGQGDGQDHAIDCMFWNGIVPYCCYVRIDARLVLNKWNTVRIKDIRWTRDEPPDTTDDDIPDNGWDACSPRPYMPLEFTFHNDDDVEVFWLSHVQFDSEGDAELTGDSLWAHAQWNITAVVDTDMVYVAAAGSLQVEIDDFQADAWLRFRATLITLSGAYEVRGQHQADPDNPTYVELASLKATGHDDFIEVAWATATEIDNAEFNIRRGLSADGDRVRINAEPIAARGDMLAGGTYTFRDYEVTEDVTYYYWLEDVDLHGNARQHGPVTARLRSRVSRPVKLFLAQNSPNPFSTATDIRFGLPTASAVRLAIYNLAGKEVRSLVNGREPAGYRTVHWDGLNDAGEDVAGGVYFCVLEAGNDMAMSKMVYMK